MTATALAHFGIIARPHGLGGFVGCVLPVRARLRLVKRGVSKLRRTTKYTRRTTGPMFSLDMLLRFFVVILEQHDL